MAGHDGSDYPVRTTCPQSQGAMVFVAGGSFFFGAQSTPTELASFCIDKYEVRAADYAACAKAGGCVGHAKWAQCKDGAKGAPNSCLSKPGELPANWIDWFRALEYCQWAGKRLPTEQQWEKAARGTDKRDWPHGSTIGCKHAHYGRGQGFDGCKGFGGLPDAPVAVNLYEAHTSPCGAVQMAGNVREWIDHRKDRSKLPEDAGYATSKGGDFREGKGGVAIVGSYGLVGPGVASDGQGFRCAADPQ